MDPTVEIWTDASLEHGGHSFHGGFAQRSWTSSDLADDPSIYLSETRAARVSMVALSEPGDHVRLHFDNRTAAAYIRCQGGTRSNLLCQEALLPWEQAVSRDVSLLPPQWFHTGGNTAAGFLSGHDMAQWIFMWNKKVFKPLLDCSRTGYFCFGGIIETMALME